MFPPKNLWSRRRNHVSCPNFGFAFDRQLPSYLLSPPDQGDKKSEPPINLLTRPLRPLLITRTVLPVSRRLSKTFFLFFRRVALATSIILLISSRLSKTFYCFFYRSNLSTRKERGRDNISAKNSRKRFFNFFTTFFQGRNTKVLVSQI